MYGLEKNYQNSKCVFLDPNHSHFVLIDDNANGELGHDIPFRIKLETELRKDSNSDSDFVIEPSVSTLRRLSSLPSINLSLGSANNNMEEELHHVPEKFNIPMILICVNGGYDALKLVHESLKQRIPILVYAVIFETHCFLSLWFI